jgi:hypothetical protein
MYGNSDLSYYYPTPTTIDNADDKPANKVQDRIRKYDELKTLVGKYCNVRQQRKPWRLLDAI